MSLLLVSCSLMSYVGLGDEEPKPEEKTIEILDFGIYEGDTLALQTTAVPKKLGSTFGFRFKVVKPETGGQVNVTITTSSPGMINPEKNEVEFKSETKDSVEVGKEYHCTFTFGQEWEMVGGDWTLEVKTENGASAKKTFQVYNPQT